MNKMQKDWLKTRAFILVSIIYVALMLACLLLGGGWLYWCAIMAYIVIIPLSVYMFYLPIANMVWYWRLMGACITDEDEKLLRSWWFFIKRSECWADYLWKEIQEMENEEWREGAEDLRTRLMCVKKPKWI